MEEKPCAVVISTTDIPAAEVVKLIVTEESFSQPAHITRGVISFPWHIDTKYYNADVLICALQEKTIVSHEFSESVQAVIVKFDSNDNYGLKSVEQWQSFFKEFNPEIRILLCDHCSENPLSGISKLTAQEWCIDNGFELVELNPEKDEEWERDQDFLETVGIERVTQALHAHVWPNLSLKGDPKGPFSLQSALVHPTVSKALLGSGDFEADDDNLTQELQNLRLRNEQRTTSDPHILDEPLDALGSGGNTDDFFELFQSLADVKERVSNMSSEDRKAAAEKVVKAFWRTIGGDAEELSDLSDLEDSQDDPG